ncbi:MAG: ABC transporter permease [Bryobacteraceae bacterium]|nr:ABC transporter permease [Bryobacteraceae bacterium]
MPHQFSRPFAGLKEDCVYGLRQFRRRPGFSLSAIAALALGIGFSTTTFSFTDAILYRPLDIPELDRFVQVAGVDPKIERSSRALAPVDFIEFRQSARTIRELSAASLQVRNLTGVADPVQATGYSVSPEFFPSVRVQPLIGRTFLPEEFTPGRHLSVVLAHVLWRTQFGEDPGVLGRSIEIDGQKHTIVGVMPEGFRFPRAVEYWTPLALNSSQWAFAGDYLECYGRLASGATLEQARAEFNAIAARLASRYPTTHRGIGARVDLLRERVSGDLTATYTRLTAGAVLFLLLIACANVANLQLARVLGRVREVAIRASVGAGSYPILRQILVESVMLSAAGALLGLPVAAWTLALMKAAMPPEIERYLPGWQRMGLNTEVLLATAVTAVGAGVLAGFGPAWWLSRRSVSAGLAESSRAATSGGSRKLRSALVIGETALAVVLLAGAALMVKGFRSLAAVQLNSDPDRLLVWNISLPESKYSSVEKVREFHRALLAEAASAPALSSVALLADLPYSDSSSSRYFSIEGRPAPAGPPDVAQWQPASSRLFSTLGIPLLEGRGIAESDVPGALEIAVVSRQFARRFFPGQPAIGKRIRLQRGEWITIAGIVADTRHDSVERRPRPVIYRPYAQAPPQSAWFVVDAGPNPAQFAPAVRAAIRRIDPSQPVARLQTYRRLVNNHVTGFAYISSMLGALGLVALFLSILGVYSLMASAVGERTRETGIRMALGATAGEVLLAVLRRGALLAASGLLIGLAAALAAARFLAQVLFGVSATGPAVFTAVPAALALSLLLACLIPARGAASTGPVTALREE